MDTVLIRERYKVVQVLWSEPDYALVEAVDIQERETPSRLINLYEGRLLHRYGRICADIRPEECPAFRGMFLCGDTLAVVFDSCGGAEIDQVFYKGDQWCWQDRLDYAELVLHQALQLANLPMEVACAAMLSENVRIDTTQRQVQLRYMLRPLPEMNPRELALLAGDQVKKILPADAPPWRRNGPSGTSWSRACSTRWWRSMPAGGRRRGTSGSSRRNLRRKTWSAAG